MCLRQCGQGREARVADESPSAEKCPLRLAGNVTFVD